MWLHCKRRNLPAFVPRQVSLILPKLKFIYTGQENYRIQIVEIVLWSFRNEGVFHEHFTNIILDDLVAALKPRWCKVIAEFAVRGGIG